MDYKEDKKLAKKVCDGDDKARATFNEKIIDDVYTVASLYNKFINEEYYFYEGIKVDDDIADTALWLFKHTHKKTCKYQGLAPLINFINNDLYKDWTKKSWIRHKTGITDYIPKAITKLSDLHIKIFIELRYKRSKEIIMENLTIDEGTFIDHYEEIKTTLNRVNMLHEIFQKKEIPLEFEPQLNQIQPAPGFYTSGNVNYTRIMEEKHIEKMMAGIFSQLEKHERRLLGLYWGHKIKPKDIFEFFSQGYPEYMSIFSITNEQDVTSAISSTIYRVFRYTQENASDFVNQYNIDKPRFRALLKRHIIYKDKKRYDL